MCCSCDVQTHMPLDKFGSKAVNFELINECFCIAGENNILALTIFSNANKTNGDASFVLLTFAPLKFVPPTFVPYTLPVCAIATFVSPTV